MYFLIDFENVSTSGLKGVEYLLPTDHVSLFYSDVCANCTGSYLRNIGKSHCSFEAVKLLRKGKNGLDSYIASKAGEIRASGYKDAIVIVSRDNGYYAVKDYIDRKYPAAVHIIIAASIEFGVMTRNEQSQRTKDAKYDCSNISIQKFSEQLHELRAEKKIDVFKSLSETKFIDKGDCIQQIVDADNHKAPVYRKLVHEFGQKDGLDIYRRIKGQLLTRDDR